MKRRCCSSASGSEAVEPNSMWPLIPSRGRTRSRYALRVNLVAGIDNLDCVDNP